ncbi:MAG: hypothetical protein H7Z41_17820 [Cytophagales bacterium]|nr:hypothetical protein [Armatimonadota bacterium]
MNQSTKSPRILTLLGSAAAAAMVLAGQTTARAQDAMPSAPAQEAPVTASDSRLRPLSTIVVTMARASGASILADSSVSTTAAPLPGETTTAANFEVQLDTLVKALPQGATWAKVYLPAPKSRMDADAVSDYVIAQAKLFGSAGAAAPAGTVEIMGQRVASDKAEAVVAALNLKPIYLITNPRLKAAGQNWAQLTTDQQQQYAKQQAQQILNMDPTTQQQFLQQQRAVMGAMMQQMTPEQRQQLFQGWGGGRGGGGGGRRNRENGDNNGN